MSYLCGQYRDDMDTQVLQSLFDQLAARNEYCIRGFYLPATPTASPMINSEGKPKVPRGVLSDFVTSLQCLAECPSREDAVQTIAQSLPQRWVLNIKYFSPVSTTKVPATFITVSKHCDIITGPTSPIPSRLKTNEIVEKK